METMTANVQAAVSRRAAMSSVVGALAVYVMVHSTLRAEGTLESRYQYYQEDHHRIRVDSNYSLFRFDVQDSLSLDGTLLYSTISGASPTGWPPSAKGGSVPVVQIKDQRTALTLGITKSIENHAVRLGVAYSDESDYRSAAYSVQDTISLNQKNTELVWGASFTDDTVEANGTDFRRAKRSYDALVGLNQVLSPTDLLSVNVSLGWRQGFLSDPYKVVSLNGGIEDDTRPGRKVEQLVWVQWTHYVESWRASVESSYRFGHNDWGSDSHTARVAMYKKWWGDRLMVGPSFRYYRQSAARFYAPSFSGMPTYYSADYRLSAEETLSVGAQVRWFAVKEKVAVDVGVERYVTRGLDHQTSPSAYPSATCVSAGLHLQF